MRYEDLVSKEHTMSLLKLLYDFMGFPYDLENINKTLGDLLHGGEKEDRGRYYSLNRDKNFDPNHWRGDLSREVRCVPNPHVLIRIKKATELSQFLQSLSEVEGSCGEVIQELGYTLLMEPFIGAKQN